LRISRAAIRGTVIISSVIICSVSFSLGCFLHTAGQISFLFILTLSTQIFLPEPTAGKIICPAVYDTAVEIINELCSSVLRCSTNKNSQYIKTRVAIR
jgi:hypothetical protein